MKLQTKTIIAKVIRIVVWFFVVSFILMALPNCRLPEPEDLITIIKEHQKRYVKTSYGQYAYQCFTDENRAQFINANMLEKIVNRLNSDEAFSEVVLKINEMSSSDQKKLLNLSTKTYKPTWNEFGSIDSSAQTNAGQEAKKMIVQAIVNLVSEKLFSQRWARNY